MIMGKIATIIAAIYLLLSSKHILIVISSNTIVATPHTVFIYLSKQTILLVSSTLKPNIYRIIITGI